jgi:hypothetical protein
MHFKRKIGGRTNEELNKVPQKALPASHERYQMAQGLAKKKGVWPAKRPCVMSAI